MLVLLVAKQSVETCRCLRIQQRLCGERADEEIKY